MSQNLNNIANVSAANQAGYDRWAASYDEAVNSTVAADELAFPQLWAHVRDRAVLEIGCGTGRHTLRLAQAGNRVTGLDLSPGMLEQAQAKLAGFTDVRLLHLDIMANEGADIGLFDAAITALVIEHIADLSRFFARVAAHLRAGANFYLSEIHPSRMQAGSGARFIDPDTGEETWLKSFAHTGEAVTFAAEGAGFNLTQQADFVADAAFSARHVSWGKYLGKPMVRTWVFRRA